jgi:fatty-acyl-CoA synthase
MLSTMQDFPLTTQAILRRGRDVFGDAHVVSLDADGAQRATFAVVADRAERLAAALARLGVGRSSRVGTLMWNHQRHQEAYLAVPSMGAVLHTLNLRLSPEQLAFVINHGEDDVVIVDDSLVPVLARVKDKLTTVRHFIVCGPSDSSALGPVLDYESLIAAEAPGYMWPDIDEREAASLCYTTGTTGDPKGVAYSHRSIFLHSLAELGSFRLVEDDRLLLVVPMFHVNAWGLPYAGWMLGADLLLPGRFLRAEPLARFIAQERPTFAAAVPTIWSDLLGHLETSPADISSLRQVICGGSAVPRRLMELFEKRHGVSIIQAWGMTETSPLGAIARPPRGTEAGGEMDWRVKTGRVVAGVEARIVADGGEVCAADGESVGEIQVRGPWIAGSYYGVDAPEKFDDGWLRTGDVGTIDRLGFIQITDRAKDVIKSGGEWISSVVLEGALMGHPEVKEAAVIGVPDERWQERPLAVVVLRDGAQATNDELREFLSDKVASWWVPERWAVVDEVPKTSVGKFDKKLLRAQHAAGELKEIGVAPPPVVAS